MEAVKSISQQEESEVERAAKKVKAQFSDRSAHLIEMTLHSGDELQFIVLAPLRAEWKKYREEVETANGDISKLETAIEKAALNLIKWPDREKVIETFNRHPGIVGHFGGQLAKLADAEPEVRSKKL